MQTKTQYKADFTERDVANDLFNPYNVNARPFLKWAGGKGQLLNKFQDLYPNGLKQNKINNFYESFLGSGAVFFDIVQKYEIEYAYLYDINEELVLTYQVIQKDVSKLIDFMYRYEKNYLKLNKTQRQEFYYDQRTNYNLQRFNIDYNKYSENWFPRASQLIFLNKTCFNGLYTVNSKGEFNLPAGDYKNPTICDEQNLLAVSKVLQNAEIRKADFKEMIKDLKSNSFVYFDPPFRPISKTSNFKSYSKQGFEDNEQIQLANLFKYLNEEGSSVMLSNSDPKNLNPNDNFFDEIYSDFNIFRVPARRMINSNASKRGTFFKKYLRLPLPVGLSVTSPHSVSLHCGLSTSIPHAKTA
ncbi:MAG: DNA adenine methylase [Paludibacteraceae bacterium]